MSKTRLSHFGSPGRAAAVFAALVLMLTLSACGSDDSAVVADTAPTSATQVEATTNDDGESAGATESTDSTGEDTVEASTAQDASDDDHTHDEDADHDHEAGSNSVESAARYLGSYTLVNDEFGTMVSVTVDEETRTIVSNSLPDHETGEFPNSGNPNTISEQSIVLEYTANPTYVGNATFAQMPGIAVNGVAFEPGTAETVTCESGETLRIEGLQDLYNLGMDFNNAHVQPTGQYHYHGIAELLVGTHDNDSEDLVLVGFAADGYLMYYSKSGAYTSGYELSSEPRVGTDCTASGAAGGVSVELDGTTPDGTYNTDWTFVADGGDLDSCNGVIIDGVYAYVLTDEYPFVPRCLNGEFTATGPGAGGAGGGGGAAPDFSEAAATLGVTEEALLTALGDPPPDLVAAAEALGVTVEELEAALPAPPGQ